MNIMHLRYALAIEETGSVTRAAERLFVAQPNISRAIRELEASVGMALFRRTSLGMVATEEGKPFLKRARHIVQEIDGLKNVYDSSGAAYRYFSACSHGGRYVAEAFAEFAAERGAEAFSYTFSEAGTSTAISGVSQGIYGLGIIRFPEDAEALMRKQLDTHELSMEKLFTAPLLYTVSTRSRLAMVSAVSGQDVASLTEITGDAVWTPEGGRDISSRRIRLHDRESRMLALRTAPDAFLLSVKEDAGFLKENGLVQRPAKGNGIEITDAVIFRKKYERTKFEKAFLEVVAEKASIYNA